MTLAVYPEDLIRYEVWQSILEGHSCMHERAELAVAHCAVATRLRESQDKAPLVSTQLLTYIATHCHTHRAQGALANAAGHWLGVDRHGRRGGAEEKMV